MSNRPVVSFTRADAIESRATDWLVDGWLVKDTLAALIGPSGSCKSFLAVDWSCRVATGSPWFGRDVEQGAVFYLAGEGRQGLRKRIHAWESFNRQSIERAPLFLADGLPSLSDDLNTASVIDAIANEAEAIFYHSGSEPRLVVIDTIARAMGGADENAAVGMGQFIQALDRLRHEWGACVLALHHTGIENPDRGRGSSALRAALDSEFIIRPGDPSFTVKASKCKDWSAPNPVTLRRVPIDIPVPRRSEEPDDPRPATVPERSLALSDDTGAQDEESKREMVLNLAAKDHGVREIARETGISKSTVSRWLKGREAGA